MKIAPPPRTTHTDPAALPILLSGGEEAVLIVHGFTGLSGEMHYLAERLWERGYTVSVPRLPGHGTRGGDFLKTSWKDWHRRVLDEFFDLKCRHDRIHLVGLSMGALLVLLIAAEFDTGKIVLAAPAVTNFDRKIKLTPLLRLFARVVPRRDYVFSGPLEYAAVSREYWRYKWIGPAADLLRLQRKAVQALPRVRADTLIIVSEKDDTVPIEAAEIIEGKIGAENVRRRVLKESGHVVLNDSERDEAAGEIIGWLENRRD